MTYTVAPGTYSKSPDRYAEGAPETIDWADGAWVGVADERWVDLTSGLGAVLLGHRDVRVDRRVRAQMESGICFPLPTVLEEAVAGRLLDLLTWERAECVRFGKNGADVTTSAVRLARAITGRAAVLYLDYHGHHDWSMRDAPWNAGVPECELDDGSYSSRIVRSWDEEPDLREYQNEGWIRHASPIVSNLLKWPGESAAVVLEGVSSLDPAHQNPDGFWKDLRQACTDSGTFLILDEMVTGFRMAEGGAAEALGIEPDLTCYGKAMANGLPLSAIVGPREYMERYAEDVFFSLTHAGEALSLAAADETLRLVHELRVPERLGDLGADVLNVFREADALDRVKYGYPQRLVFDFSREELGVLLSHGVLSASYANFTLAHCEDQAARETILEAFRAVLS